MVVVEHEKVGRIMQDGGSALDNGDIRGATVSNFIIRVILVVAVLEA